jgi:hypothetical protein
MLSEDRYVGQSDGRNGPERERNRLPGCYEERLARCPTRHVLVHGSRLRCSGRLKAQTVHIEQLLRGSHDLFTAKEPDPCEGTLLIIVLLLELPADLLKVIGSNTV